MNLSHEFRVKLNSLIEDTVSSWYQEELDSLDKRLEKLFFFADVNLYHQLLDTKIDLTRTRDTEINRGRVYLEKIISTLENYEPYYTATESYIEELLTNYLNRRSVFTNMGEGAILANDISMVSECGEPEGKLPDAYIKKAVGE